MNDDKIGLSRRKMLVGLGAVGVASAGAGLGTTAYFNDTETFENNTLTAGELDLFVHVDYSEDQGSYGDYSTPEGTYIDGNVVGGSEGDALSIEVSDLKPGDSGEGEFCFSIVDNPAYMWMCGELTANDENGQTEPETDADATNGDPGEGMGELADAMQVTVSYCTADGEDGDEIVSGSLADVMNALSNGVPLHGDGNPDAPIANRVPFDGVDSALDEDDEPNIDDQCVCFEWVVPTSVGNEIQTDSVAFDFEFYAEQARHNDGTNNPCVDVEKVDGDGWGKLEIDDFGTSDMQAKIRSPYPGVEQFAGLGTAGGSSVVTSAENALPDDEFVDFELAYDGAGTLDWTVDGVTTTYNNADLGVPTDKIEITARADTGGAETTVQNVELATDSVVKTFSQLVADDSGKKYCGWVGVPDLADGFTLSGEVALDYDLAVTSELVAMYVHVDTSA